MIDAAAAAARGIVVNGTVVNRERRGVILENARAITARRAVVMHRAFGQREIARGVNARAFCPESIRRNRVVVNLNIRQICRAAKDANARAARAVIAAVIAGVVMHARIGQRERAAVLANAARVSVADVVLNVQSIRNQRRAVVENRAGA